MAARPRFSVVAVGVALACLLLAGCAEAPVLDRTATPEESLARVRATAARVTAAKSARLSMVVRTTFAGEEVAASTATTVGVYDYAARKGQMDISVKTAGIPFRFTQRTLLIGSAVYLETPEPPELPDGGPPVTEEPHKPWVKLELPEELVDDNGFGPSLLGLGFGLGSGYGPEAGDPTEALQYLTAASSKAAAVGEEQVRGVPTIRYAVTLDPSEQAAQLPKELKGVVEESELAFPKPADVWIDEEGRLRKIQYALTMKIPTEETTSRMTIEAAGSQVTVETTLELYDFGVEVHVTPPPADQVEIIGPGLPPDCMPEKGKAKGTLTGDVQQDPSKAESRACLEFSTSAPPSGSTGP